MGMKENVKSRPLFARVLSFLLSALMVGTMFFNVVPIATTAYAAFSLPGTATSGNGKKVNVTITITGVNFVGPPIFECPEQPGYAIVGNLPVWKTLAGVIGPIETTNLAGQRGMFYLAPYNPSGSEVTATVTNGKGWTSNVTLICKNHGRSWSMSSGKIFSGQYYDCGTNVVTFDMGGQMVSGVPDEARSEERRVGKEC